MDSAFKSPVVLSFCPGFLGLERGLERAIGKLRIAAYVEIEAFICANLVAGMESGVLETSPVWTNVKTFPAQGFRNKVHGIIGGYPCQPFSLAGERKGADDPRHLWPHIERHINAIRPVWCFFENVSGHLSLGFPEVYTSLRNMGYAVEAGIFTAEEAGAPHQRERLFILAVENTYLAAARGECRQAGRGTGQQDVRQGNGQDGAVWTGPAGAESELANPGSQRKGAGFREVQETDGEIPQWDNHAIPKQPSEGELANPDHERSPFAGPGRFGQLPEESGSGLYDRPEQPGGNGMADTKEPGLERAITAGDSPARGCTGEYDDAPGFDRWPARPGEPQYEWEEPRTIERRMGSAIDGYHFREDLLRAYGNSVVEQTAEIAFINLYNKFFK